MYLRDRKSGYKEGVGIERGASTSTVETIP